MQFRKCRITSRIISMRKLYNCIKEDTWTATASSIGISQQGDYHVGNLIITENNKIGVIDFNRYDFGDPWEEFNRIVFSLSTSIPFGKVEVETMLRNINKMFEYYDYFTPYKPTWYQLYY